MVAGRDQQSFGLHAPGRHDVVAAAVSIADFLASARKLLYIYSPGWQSRLFRPGNAVSAK